MPQALAIDITNNKRLSYIIPNQTYTGRVYERIPLMHGQAQTLHNSFPNASARRRVIEMPCGLETGTGW